MVYKLRDIFDTSNYSVTHPLYNADRKNVTGYLKNETPEMNVVKFVGMRSKCYAMKMEAEMDNLVQQFASLKSVCYDFTPIMSGGKEQEVGRKKHGKTEILRAKGVNKHARQNQKYQTYEDSLFSMKEVSLKQRSLQSKSHHNMLIEQNKIAISPFDAKRALTCLIHTVPYGSSLLAYRNITGKCFACEHPEDLF